MPGPGVEPYGADDFVRQAAVWAGSGPGTGLLIFNDSAGFVGGAGWNNPELNLPVAWGITDLFQAGGFADGGYTDIVAAFASHPVYAGLSDSRFGVNSISSFAANVGDGSFDSIFGAFNAGIFAPTEVVTNARVVDVGGLCPSACSQVEVPGPDGTAITLIRDRRCDEDPPEVACVETVNPHGQTVPPAGRTTLPGPRGGQNDDGFYELRAQDGVDPNPQIFVLDTGSGAIFGPFSSGDKIKYTEAPGATPSSKAIGSGNGQAGAIAAHITGMGDAAVFAVDAAGNQSLPVRCLVPPPPK